MRVTNCHKFKQNISIQGSNSTLVDEALGCRLCKYDAKRKLGRNLWRFARCENHRSNWWISEVIERESETKSSVCASEEQRVWHRR